MEFDAVDLSLLDLMQQDAGRSTADLAEQLNMSQSPCWRRISKLEQAGVIDRKVALIDRKAVGMDLVAFTTVNLSVPGRKNLETFERAVAQFDEVMECYTMTGAWDYMLKIVVADIAQFEDFVRNSLLELPMIGEIHSHLAVTEIKYSTALPLDRVKQ